MFKFSLIGIVAVLGFSAITQSASAAVIYSGTGFPDVNVTNGNRGYTSFRSGASWSADAQPASLTQSTSIDTWNIVTFTDETGWSNLSIHDIRINVWKATETQTLTQAFLASPEVGNAYTTDVVSLVGPPQSWGVSNVPQNLGYYAELDFADFVLPAGDYLWSVNHRDTIGTWTIAESDLNLGSGYAVFGSSSSTLRLNTSLAGSTTGSLAMDIGGTPVPEPSSLALLALGGFAALRRRRA